MDSEALSVSNADVYNRLSAMLNRLTRYIENIMFI